MIQKHQAMKTSYVLFLLFLSFGSARAQSFEMDETPVDTINKIMRNGSKEGKWVIKGKHYNYGLKKEAYRGFQPEQTIETGMYKNNRKEGMWEEYYKNGKLRNKLTYVNGVLEGAAVFYNIDGKVLKEGNFKGNKWVK
jgi:antitoxin component YwqK of YwqJK toxin-antitoxin module